jgi:hypothetical protein
MMRINRTVIHIFFFVVISCNGEKHEKIYYESGKIKSEYYKNKQGKLNGVMINYYENGDTMTIKTWENGVQVGKELEYYKNNKIKAEFIFEKGKPNGEFIIYYISGNINTTGKLINDKISGTLLDYYDSKDKKVLKKTNYINFHDTERLVGWVEYNEDGTVKNEESRIILKPLADTVSLGDSVVIKIELTVPRYDSTYFFVGNFGDKFYMNKTPKIDTFYSKNHSILFKEIATRKGVNYIRGGAKNYGILPPSKEGNRREIRRPEVYFEYKYLVR